MIQVAKIIRIRGLGVFRSFDWPDDLPEFRRYNVIYGWNWTGKTLLSRIFAALKKGQPLDCEDIVLKLSSREQISNRNFSDASWKVKVRVFNRDFIDENVYKSGNSIQPIYVFGERSKEKQQELDAIVKRFEENYKKKESKERDLRRIEQQLSQICSDGAKEVREVLNIPGRNYERDEFRRDIETVEKQGGSSNHLISQEEKKWLDDVIRAESRRKLDTLSFSFMPVVELFQEAKKLCGRTVVAAVIEELQRRPDVNVWAEEGLKLQKKYGTKTCLFCNQALPNERLQALEAHFSEAYREMIDSIEKLMKQIDNARDEAKALHLPDADVLYADLRPRYKDKQKRFSDARQEFLERLDALENVLKDKRNNPFRDLGAIVPSLAVGDEAIAAINEIIAEHNKKVDNREQEIDKARQKLKNNIIAKKIDDYRNLRAELEAIKDELGRLQQEASTMETRRQALERDLVEHRRPADELNRELASYLGHSEIQFDVEKTGYKIVRNGKPATSLSEGEKTAIAFLYFLKTLEDKDFDINNGIVVVDDPVSSLDSNALYHAFGFMKSRVGNAGQLFVLTHNFLFFRQVRNWFSYLPKKDKKEARYYMLTVIRDDTQRSSRIKELDPLLKNYSSEYHYLFSLVYKASKADSPASCLEQYHYLPNVARRLLEAFLEFRAPGTESIYKRLDNIDYNQEKKTRIIRFCDTHSHCKLIDDVEQDPLFLNESIDIAKDIMNLIKKVDREHYNQMERLIGEQDDNEYK